MTRYQLAKLISWAGTLHSRKRLQKLVVMLQAAGAPLNAEYRLHHFGPYSNDVAHLVDEMVQLKLLLEAEKPNVLIGKTYDYSLSDKAKTSLSEFESTEAGHAESMRLECFRPVAEALIGEGDLKVLEYAATLVYFRKKGLEWSIAYEETRKFKKLPVISAPLSRASELAKRIAP
jgi:uncharacterized protein